MSKINIEIPYEVTPCGRPRVTKYGTFYGKNYTFFREIVGKWFQYNYREERLVGPITAKITFKIKTPKSWSKKKTEAMNGKPCLKNYDLDNMEKAVYDVMEGVCYENDSQIWKHATEKIWDKDKGSITVKMWENE